MFALFVALSAVVGHAEGKIPDDIRKVINEHVVGEWSFDEEFDGSVTRGETIARWTEGNESVVTKVVIRRPTGPVYINGILGWHSDSKSIVEHGYSSTGDYWTIRWTDLSMDGVWKGEGNGIYKGKKWESPTKIAFKEDSFRYEDTTDGKPFVIVYERRKPVDAREAFEAFANYLAHGTWVTTNADGKTIMDRHVWHNNKKFVEIERFGDSTVVSATYGVDPRNDRLTLWGFLSDGAVRTWRLANYSPGTWVWEGNSVSPNGKTSERLVLTKVNDDENRVTIEIPGEAPLEKTWKRQH